MSSYYLACKDDDNNVNMYLSRQDAAGKSLSWNCKVIEFHNTSIACLKPLTY